jgi:hypothetical protein
MFEFGITEKKIEKKKKAVKTERENKVNQKPEPRNRKPRKHGEAWCPHIYFIVLVVVCIFWRLGSSTSSPISRVVVMSW